jgi:hypothetical protein
VITTRPTPASLIGFVSMENQAESRAAFERARRVLDETILLALVAGPLRVRQLRAAAMPFGDYAVHQALRRLIAIGEIAREGQTTACVYRLVQRTATAPAAATGAGRTVRSDGDEFMPVWPLASDPKAPPSALNREARR